MKYLPNKRWIKSMFILIIIGLILFTLIHFFNDENQPQKSGLSIQKASLTVGAINAHFSEWQLNTVADGRIMPWHEAIISAQTNGLVISKLYVDVGDHVTKGQILIEFDDETIKANLLQLIADVEEAEANYYEAKLNADRASKLLKNNAISDREFQELNAIMLSCRSRLASAKAAQLNGELNLNRTKIFAPDDGVISFRQASLGSVPNVSDALFKMIIHNRLEWQAEVVVHKLNQIVIGQKAIITLTNNQQVTGSVRQIAPSINISNNTTIVYVDLESNAFALSGMFVEGELQGKSHSYLTLPQSAIIMRDGFYYVFKIVEDHSVVQTKVTIQAHQNNQVAILTGISENDLLVASGVNFLKDGDIVHIVEMLSDQGNGL